MSHEPGVLGAVGWGVTRAHRDTQGYLRLSGMCLTLDPKQYWNNWKNGMSLFSATNQERPYEQLLHNWTEPRRGWESSFSLKIRPILIPARDGVTIRDLIGRDEKTRGRGKRKVSTRNCKGEYVKTRCLGNERFLSSDEYCVKETNEEKRKQRNIMAHFIESWGLRGSVSSFSLHLPLRSSFHGCSLSNFRTITRSELTSVPSLYTVQPPLAT